MSLKVPKSATTTYGNIFDDKCDPDISVLAQGSTILRPQSVDRSTSDEGKIYLDIAVPSNALPSTQPLHSLRPRNAWHKEDSRAGVSIAPATVDHSIREARSEHYHGIPIQREKPLPELPSTDREDGVVQSKEAMHGVDSGLPLPTEPTVTIKPSSVVGGRDDPDFSVSKGVATVMTELDSVDHGDSTVQRGGPPFTSFFHGSSNFEITGSNFYDVDGDVTIIRFGDGQFTDVQGNLICDYIANLAVLPNMNHSLRRNALTQSIIILPRAEAMFNDYQTKKKSGPCFEGTRVVLLREMADWVIGTDESRMYVLSGLAGIGKSTVAYTIASRAADLNLLGASFFFSRDEADRNNAKKFFTTIAYQLCVYNEMFAKAIGDVLNTEHGSAATTKDPQDQLQALILDPLRSIIQSRARPILLVIDALDECNEDDERSVVKGLTQLVRELPSFKIILTTRPQPYFERFLSSHGSNKIFRLQDIEDKVVDGDIRLYLNHSLSLEVVQECYPHRQWYASDEDIDSLVQAAGRLFIIASTAIRYILDKSASNPAAQMQKLLEAFARYHTPFKDLDHFYTVILRNVVPENCDNDDTVSRYQSVVGAIIFVQRPLPVSTLAYLINIDVVEIREVLDNLQSVILLGSDDVPHIYHKSFPDYLTDQARCEDPRLRIDTRIRHTQIATRCFGILDELLKHNILGLSDPAQFMSNEDGLEKDGITDEHMQERIPPQLRYACVYWASHLEGANIEDSNLMNRLAKFVDEHILHWLEVLSLIGNLDLAHRAIVAVLALLTSMSVDLHQLLSDALRFIGKFYEFIKRSALHTYYSALPFTPSDSLLYRRYIKKAEHNLCSIEGGSENWDALVANMSHGEPIDIIKFSLESTLFVSCSQGKSKIWDAATGTPISLIPGDMFAVANDFATVASSDDKTITFYDVNGRSRDTMCTASKIQELVLSSDSSRVATVLADGTVGLWNIGNAKSIDCSGGSKDIASQLQFSPTGTRLAYSSANSIKLRDGISGGSIADLPCGSRHKFKFSGDGSRLASVSQAREFRLWKSESGVLVSATTDVGWRCLAISANGSLFATADDHKVTLLNKNRNYLTQTFGVVYESPQSMAFSLDNILAITTSTGVKLYDVKTHSFIHTLSLMARPIVLAFSPDCTRLAVGDQDGNVNIWDIRSIDASGPPSKEKTSVVTALALSRDCSRLTCGFEDGKIELWGTSSTKRRIDPLALRSKMETIFFRIFHRSRHTKSVQTLGFAPNGRLFASGSDDGTIKLWNSGDGTLRETLEASGGLQAVALSNSVLVAASAQRQYSGVTVWSLDTRRPIHTFDNEASKVSIADNSTLVAACLPHSRVALLDVVNRTTIAKFRVPFDIHTMTFLHDNSQLVVQSDKGAFRSLDLIHKCIINGPTFEHLIQLPNTPLWHGVPIWHCHDKDSEQHYFAGLFSQHKSPVPVLWIPREIRVMAWTQGPSMVALVCNDGRVILVRPPTSHIS